MTHRAYWIAALCALCILALVLLSGYAACCLLGTKVEARSILGVIDGLGRNA